MSEELQEQLAVDEEQLNRQYREVFGTPEGRGVLKDLIQECGLFEYFDSGTSSEQLQYSSGKRAVILYIMQRYGYDENTLTDQLKEAG